MNILETNFRQCGVNGCLCVGYFSCQVNAVNSVNASRFIVL